MRLVEADNPQAAARAVKEIAESPPLRLELGRGAQALASAFAWDRIAQRTVDFFASLLQGER